MTEWDRQFYEDTLKQLRGIERSSQVCCRVMLCVVGLWVIILGIILAKKVLL
jgi:hypothetical protein